MRSVNKVILVGNVTRDPDTRQTQNGQKIVTFGLATNRQWKSASGDKQDQAEFHELVAWSRLADLCEKYVRKGKLLYVEGYLKTRSWDTPEGVRRFKTEVVVQDLIMLEKKSDEDDDFDYHEDEDDSSYDEAPISKPVVTSTPDAAPIAGEEFEEEVAAPEAEAGDETPAVSAADPNEDFSF